MNKIAKALSDPEDKAVTSTQIGYLPYANLLAYKRIAQDWLNVLQTAKLPDGHLFEPLFRITGLNVLVYLAERARDEQKTQRSAPIVADLTDGENQYVREDARTHLNLHRDEANRAVAAFVKNALATNQRWNLAIEKEDPGMAKQAIEECFKLGRGQQDNEILPPGKQIEKFIQFATAREKNNIYKYILPLTRGSGLASSKLRVGPWFVIDDSMILALVLANVDRTIELRDFIARLYNRYRLVIGPEEARFEYERIHAEHYEANLVALENRMTRLDLTERLSDDCAFVKNPYR